jgi:predicted amidohydrolase YtcJ
LLSLLAGDGADLVLVGGRVFTGVRDHWFAEAVAIAGDRILKVGSESEIQALVQAGTDVIELDGKLVAPGFADANNQLPLAIERSVLDLSAAKTFSEVGALLEKYARDFGTVEWIEACSFELSDLPAGTVPSSKLIDKIEKERPVALVGDGGQVALVNGAALARLKIKKGTPDPPGGRIERDAQGEPTGWLVGTAARLAWRPEQKAGEVEVQGILHETKAQVLKVGITSIASCLLPAAVEALLPMTDWGEFPLHVVAWPRLSGGGAQQQIDACLKLARASKASPLVSVQAPLLTLDGMLDGRSAALLEPYADANAQRGVSMIPDKDLAALVKRANESGLAVAIEASGDAAVRAALDAIAAVPAGNRQRNAILHPMLIDAADLPRFAVLDVIAVMQPGWLPGEVAKPGHLAARLGAARAERVCPLQSLLAAGAVIAFGSQANLGPLDPMTWVYGASTRQGRDGKPPQGFGAGERISLEEAMRAASFGGAYAAHAESDRGTIEKGKLADLVVLSRDPLQGSASDLLGTKVDIVIQRGRVVLQPER